MSQTAVASSSPLADKNPSSTGANASHWLMIAATAINAVAYIGWIWALF